MTPKPSVKRQPALFEIAEPCESGVRQKAARRLWRLTKFGERSRAHYQHGPFALINDQNTIVYSQLSLGEASQILDRMKPAKLGID